MNNATCNIILILIIVFSQIRTIYVGVNPTSYNAGF